MSRENVETVRRAWEAWNADDLDAFLAELHPAVEWHPSLEPAFEGKATTSWLEYWADDIDYRAAEGALDDRGPIHGKDALRAYVQDWFDTFDDFRQEPVELIDAGEDKVIPVLRVTGRAKLSGVKTDLTYAAVYTFRDGKIAVGREYFTREEALEAAGLSE
jgi:ketosteroid isomerase-like protein